HRPGVATPHPWLVLAGDLVRTDLPVALMERAATTGFQAANALLARWGVRGHPLWTGPRAGRSAILRAAATLGWRGRAGAAGVTASEPGSAGAAAGAAQQVAAFGVGDVVPPQPTGGGGYQGPQQGGGAAGEGEAAPFGPGDDGLGDAGTGSAARVRAE